MPGLNRPLCRPLILAIAILALSDAALAGKLKAYREKQTKAVLEAKLEG